MMRNLPVLILLLVLLVIMSGLPIGLLSWLLFGPQAGQAMFWLVGLLVGSFIPLKIGIDALVKQGSGLRIPLGQLSPAALMIGSLALVVVIPILWFATAPAFFGGALVYLVTGNALATVVFALLLQIISLVRLSRIEKASGRTSSVFSRMTQMQDTFNMETIIITQDGVYRSADNNSAYLLAETPTEPEPITITASSQDNTEQADSNR